MRILILLIVFSSINISFAQQDKTYTDINNALKNYDKVYKLDLNWKKLGTLPDSIQYMTHLTYLRVSSNKLTEFPEVICKLSHLTELDISWNQITSLPSCIGNLKELTKLTANSNKITKLPESITNLKNLEEIDLSYNKLVEIPENIGNLTQLKQIKLGSNELQKLPNSMGNLVNLESLDIGFNSPLQSIPESILQLTQLKNLDEIKEKQTELIQNQASKKEYEAQQKKQQEEISHFNYALKFDTKDLLDPETGEFTQEKEQYEKLPWKIEDIYNYLKTKKDFIYNIERFSYKKNKIVDKAQFGFKILVDKNQVIESAPYNYSKKELVEKHGLLADFKTTISLDSSNVSMKFMPFNLLTPFRVLDEIETLKIGKKSYECVQVEGTFLFQKMKYWMDKNQPGLIVKVIAESTYSRQTWTLKKVK